jgi:hypothetical protein
MLDVDEINARAPMLKRRSSNSKISSAFSQKYLILREKAQE